MQLGGINATLIWYWSRRLNTDVVHWALKLSKISKAGCSLPSFKSLLFSLTYGKINKAAKDYLRGQFREWYALQVCSQIKGETDTKPVDLRLSIIKPLSAKWIVSMYEYIKSNPALVSNGFKEAGIVHLMNTIYIYIYIYIIIQ